MTKPKKATATPPSTFSSYMLLIVKILLAAVIILLLPKLVTGDAKPGGRRNKRLLQHFDAMRSNCERSSTCKDFLPEESLMCVSHCISSTCHELVYGSNPLEDGEIDVQRSRDFERCVKDEIRNERSKERAAARQRTA